MSQCKERILEISKKYGLSHIGSCVSVLPILEEIYQSKKPEDKVVLDNAHAHLAHMCVREAYEGYTGTEEHTQKDIHCNREAGCDASGGSLGHGIGIGIGMALANRDRDVHVIVSDGGAQEGSFFESLRIASELELNNLKIHLNCNGYGAYKEIPTVDLEKQISGFNFPIKVWRTNSNIGSIKGLNSHYQTLNENTYREAIGSIIQGEG